MPELTVFRQSPWQADRRVKVAAVPYRRPTAPTWVHEAGWVGGEGGGLRGAREASGRGARMTGPRPLPCSCCSTLAHHPLAERYSTAALHTGAARACRCL